MTTYICPNGHEIEADYPADPTQAPEIPECHECGLTATHFNGKTGKVSKWTKTTDYREGCERLQEMMDDAFCNQYFPEW